MRKLMSGSEIRESHREGDSRVQDPYCIRCQPQVPVLRRRQLAQTATEYMLVISVIVIALTAAVYNPMNAALGT